MNETSAADWAARYTQVISKQVRHYRDVRGVSAQWLSDRCADLGMPLARAVISNLENGRREGVSVGEVFCIARALAVPPIDLLTGGDGDTEIAPGLTVDRASAASWIAGMPDVAALNAVTADLAQAQRDAERAHRAMEEASRRLGDILGASRLVAPLEPFSAKVGGDAPQAPRLNAGTDDTRPNLGVRKAIDASLQSLGQLDDETMSASEKALAEALRQLCVAIEHQAACEA
jgi:transcriptional regulator with XRE-family HTH domain